MSHLTLTSAAALASPCRTVKVDLSGQVVVVTGAGRGIGKEIASVAAGAGATSVLVARTAAQLDAAVAEIEQQGGKAWALPADLAQPDAAGRVVAQVIERHGQIDVLVNNAATNYVANLVMAKDEGWRRLYELNVFAVMRLTQAAIKPMIRRKRGRIVNIGSVSGELGAAYNSAYASSKAAIDGFTRSVAKEVAKLGITVNSIRPWHVDTELVHEAMAARAKLFGKTAEDYIAMIIAESPQQRLITAREIAALAVFLMSEDARGITGQALNVCGGYAM